jgi:hypothetical protein
MWKNPARRLSSALIAKLQAILDIRAVSSPLYMDSTTLKISGVAVDDADYLVKTADADLTNERVVTDTTTVTWDWSTAGQAKANAVGSALAITALTGDVTATGPGSVAATIANTAVTNAKMANMAQSTLKGRAAGVGTGDPTDLTATQATDILNAFTGDSGAGGVKGLVPAPASGDAAASKFLKADGTWSTTPDTDTGITQLTGDVTAGPGSGSQAATIGANKVTYAKIQTVTASRLLGNDASGTACEELTVSGGLEFTTGGIQRSALTGDVTATAGSNATTIANDAVTTAKIINDAVTDAKLRNSGALSVIGRSANSSGDPADISATAASGAVLRESGSTVGFGTVATAGIADAAVTLAKMANIADATMLGNNTGGAAAPVALTAAQVRTLLSLVVGVHVQQYDSDLADLASAGSNGTGAFARVGSPTFTGSPLAPTQTTGDNSTKLATTAYVRTALGLGQYQVIMRAGGSLTAGQVAGTYGLAATNALVLVATGTLYPINIIHILSADYPSIDGLTPKLRLKLQLYTNDVAPTGNYTIGLYPISRPGISGGAGICIYTYGTVVTGSNGASYTTPAADSAGYSAGSDFALPPDGAYAIALVTTATVAANSHIHIQAELQLHYT